MEKIIGDSASAYVFSRDLTDGSHVRRFAVQRSLSEGWRIRDERDEVVRQVSYEDWHRVELAIRRFAAEAAELTRRGWRILH